MTDRYEKIRKALAMGPTPGEWYWSSVNTAAAELIAVCDPDTIREMLAERDQLAAALEAAQEASPAEDEGRAITAVEVTLFGRECWLPADIAQEVEQACAARDLADGEEIMVNTAAPSGSVGVEGLLQRIDAAIERVTTGRAAMRSPADPTDPDLVLADARDWIKQAALAPQSGGSDHE